MLYYPMQTACALSFPRGGPPTTYGSLCFTMCQMIVANRRITATEEYSPLPM